MEQSVVSVYIRNDLYYRIYVSTNVRIGHLYMQKQRKQFLCSAVKLNSGIGFAFCSNLAKEFFEKTSAISNQVQLI